MSHKQDRPQSRTIIAPSIELRAYVGKLQDDFSSTERAWAQVYYSDDGEAMVVTRERIINVFWSELREPNQFWSWQKRLPTNWEPTE